MPVAKGPLAWDNERDRAYGRLKDELATTPLLRHPRPDAPHIIDCDAPRKGQRAILQQHLSSEPVPRILLMQAACPSVVSVTRRNKCSVNQSGQEGHRSSSGWYKGLPRCSNCRDFGEAARECRSAKVGEKAKDVARDERSRSTERRQRTRWLLEVSGALHPIGRPGGLENAHHPAQRIRNVGATAERLCVRLL